MADFKAREMFGELNTDSSRFMFDPGVSRRGSRLVGWVGITWFGQVVMTFGWVQHLLLSAPCENAGNKTLVLIFRKLMQSLEASASFCYQHCSTA